METKKRSSLILTGVMTILCIAYILPIVIVLVNSFKGQFFINESPFSVPVGDMFAGISNYIRGIEKTGFISAFFYSLFITVGSVIAILVLTSMTAWYITRVKGRFSSLLYYLFVFSMIIPFQMVMFTMTKTANTLRLDNPIGIIFIYCGFGAGLSVFMFTGFIKSIPISMEEAAMIDGCSPPSIFFNIVIPLLWPTAVTIAILNTMWIWNDYLLPYLVIGSDYKTIPIAIQYLRGGYGSIDMGAMMAMLVLAIIPIIIFYIFCQKYIIEGVVSGAVKG